MNKIFAEYTTGTAFFMQLSKRQCWGLLALEHATKQPDHWLHSGQFIALRRDLELRGLVEHHQKKPYNRLTRAGRIMVMLLKEAGMTMQNTQTLSVIKGLAQWHGERAA